MRDRAHGARVAAVDARLAVEDLVAHDLRFQREADVLRRRWRPGRLRCRRRSPSNTRFQIASMRLRARLLLPAPANAARRSASASAATRATSASSLAGAFQSHAGLAAASASSLIAWIAACICSWPNTTAPSITSSDSSCASDSTISTACSVPATTRLSFESFSCVAVGLSTYWPLSVADARGADRAVERNAGQRQRRRNADHRRDVGIDFRVDRHDRAPPPGLRCRSRPGTAAGSGGRSGARSASPSPKAGPRA